MKSFGVVAEFGLVVAFGVTLTVRAMAPLAESPVAPAPTFEQIEAAVAHAEAQAAAANGGRR